LRGFYFSGVRAVVVNDALPIAVGQQSTSYSHASAERDATNIFQFSRDALQSSVSVTPLPAAGRKVPEWTFVEHLFNEILLRDQIAMGTSAVSAKVSYWRRALLAISNAEPLTAQLPAAEQLRRLDALRDSLETLSQYEKAGAPWYMRSGLYVGDRLYPPARSLYFTQFYNLLLAQTQGRLLTSLQTLPGTPAPSDDYGRTYDDLKAYLITTSNHDKSTRMFLPPVLIRRWGEGRAIDPERVQLADKQFEYYAQELKLANPYSSENDSLAVERARAYLAKFGGTERTYRSIVEEASQATPSISFSQRFPGTESVLVAPQVVGGAYTKQGWEWVQNAIQNNLNRFYRGETWVLGNQGDNLADERIRVQDQLHARYVADFANQWRNMLKSASVVHYAGLKDAAAKLRILSGNQSPLLELLWLVSEHTAVSPEIASIFQPVHTVIPPSQNGQADRYIGPGNQSYMNALVGVQTSVEAVVDPAVDKQAVDQSISASVSALRTTAEIANTFRIDSDGHVETTVRNLMEQPITTLDAMLRSSSAGALNGKGRELCSSLNSLAAKYPFNPRSSTQASIQDLNAIFQPQGGTLWSFYASAFGNYIVREGAQFKANPNGGVRINPAFLAFLNRASKFTDTLYSGSAQPHVSFTMHARSTEGMEGVTLNINGQTLAGSSSATQFLWPGSGPQEVKLTGRLPGGSELLLQDFQGPWAVFQFLGEADHRASSGSAETLEWIAKTGGSGQPMRLPDGRRVTVSFDLSAGTAAPIFTAGFFSGLRCVPTVAQE
jgi:type VI secretion system protein ImpL